MVVAVAVKNEKHLKKIHELLFPPKRSDEAPKAEPSRGSKHGTPGKRAKFAS